MTVTVFRKPHMKSVSCRSKMTCCRISSIWRKESYQRTSKMPAVLYSSEKMEVIDWVLRHDSAADQLQWCIAVPIELQQDLIAEAHASLFSGHLSEQKVYDRLRRWFWWQGMWADVRRFCRECLNCVSRREQCTPHCSQYQCWSLCSCWSASSDYSQIASGEYCVTAWSSTRVNIRLRF